MNHQTAKQGNKKMYAYIHRTIFLEDNAYLYECDDEDKAMPISEDEAIDLIVNFGWKDDCGVADSALKIANADPGFLRTLNTLKRLAIRKGWKIKHHKDVSLYVEVDNIVVRFSNHELSSDWTGRAQTGGADVDLVWGGHDARKAIEEIADLIEEYLD